MKSSLQPQPALAMNHLNSNSSYYSAALMRVQREPWLPVISPRCLARRVWLLALVVACAVVILSPPEARAANASPPGKVAYQGFLTDANGVPLGNDSPVNTNVIFRIFDASTGGTLKWAEQQVVTVDKGHFSIFLGEGAQVGGDPFSEDLTSIFGGPDASHRFIGITVGSTTIAPRLQFLPAPYAMLAANARNIVGPNGDPLADTASGFLTVPGGMAVNGNSGAKINLHSSGDQNHYIGYDLGLNGPQIAGFAGGGLAITDPGLGGLKNILQWNPSGVSISGSMAVNGNSGAKINLHSSGDQNHYIRYDSGLNGPQIGGFAGGGLAITDPGLGGLKNILQWNPSGVSISGSVGIGTSSPAARLHVSGGDARFDTANGRTFDVMGWGTRTTHGSDKNKHVDFVRSNNGIDWTLVGGTSQGGGGNRTMTYDGDSNLDFYSDRRLKTNIVDAESVLGRVMDIKMRRFRWIDGNPTSRPELGVIAQEFEPLFPELVTKHKSSQENPACPDGVYTVGITSLGTIAIKAIQEVKQEKDREIASLREMNKEQAAKIASLETEMSELKRLVARIAEAQKNNRPVAAADQAAPRVGSVAGR